MALFQSLEIDGIFWVWVKVPNLPNLFGFGSDSKNHVCNHTLTSYVFSGLHISRVFICPLNHRKKWLVTIILTSI